jgi:hypothetical protein
MPYQSRITRVAPIVNFTRLVHNRQTPSSFIPEIAAFTRPQPPFNAQGPQRRGGRFIFGSRFTT